MAINLVISGCCGKMGSRIAALAARDTAFTIAGAIETTGHPAMEQDVGVLLGIKTLGVRVTDDARAAIRQGEVLIEFTQPEPTVEHVELARGLNVPMVIGTTGLSEAQRGVIREAAKDIPIVLSPNMSVGVNLLFELVQAAATRLGPAYDIEIVEAHHRTKQDAPSGTAKRLAELIAGIRHQPIDTIPVHPIRAGDVVGDHVVIFAGQCERLELTHRAHSRDVFAVGALQAARFVVRSRPAGLYDMRDVLR
jgi:4-hydroxy-tetrahydrodipicolinate reductase